MDRGTTAKDRIGMRRRVALAACTLVLLAAAGGATGCGSDNSAEDAAAARRQAVAAALHARELSLGQRVFATHCGTCHTLGGKHYTGPIIEFEAPNLDEVKLKRRYVRYRLEFGGPSMASFSNELPRRNFHAVLTYVTETAGGNVHDDGQQPDDQLTAGKQVFDAHCAGCHAIAGRVMTGRPVYPGIDFTLTKPSERYVIQRLKTGVLPEEPMMPSFRGKLSGPQMQDVAAYITAVAKEGPEAPVRTAEEEEEAEAE